MQDTPARVTTFSVWAQPRLLLKATRPRQWAKNLLVFLAFFFTIGTHATSGPAGEFSLLGKAGLAFLVFCCLSGAIYLIDDLADAEGDRQHPQKRLRPIASGRLNANVARVGAATLAIVGLAGAFVMNIGFGYIGVAYLILNLAYSAVIKHQVILDVFSVSAGFVLRAVAGAVIINVPISPWLYVMTSLGALMIALGKRRTEITSLGEDSAAHRAVLDQYTVPFVDQMIAVVAPATVVAYTLYTFTAPNLPASHAMMLTIPFVMYGVFRYLFLMHNGVLAGEPEEIFLTDRPLLVNNMLWLATATAILLLSR